MFRRRRVVHPDWWGKPLPPIPWVLELPPEPKSWPQPWRDNPRNDDAFLVRREVLLVFAQGERLSEISRNLERLAWIQESMDIDGIKEPLELVIDSYGIIVLRDGHHRLLCAGELGMEELPIILTASERSRTGPHVSTVLRRLIEAP